MFLKNNAADYGLAGLSNPVWQQVIPKTIARSLSDQRSVLRKKASFVSFLCILVLGSFASNRAATNFRQQIEESIKERWPLPKLSFSANRGLGIKRMGIEPVVNKRMALVVSSPVATAHKGKKASEKLIPSQRQVSRQMENPKDDFWSLVDKNLAYFEANQCTDT